MVSPTVGYALWRIFATSRSQQLLRQKSLQSIPARSCASSVACSSRKYHRVRSATGVRKNPFQLSELRERLGGRSVRCLSSDRQTLVERPLDINIEEMKNEKWIPVYRFKGIVKYVFISKLKMLQTVASLLYLPYSYYQFIDEQISRILSISLLPLRYLLLLCYTSFSRIIGVISINSDSNIDVVPLSESLEPSGVFVKFSRYSDTDNYLLLSTREVEIVDEALSTHIFGTNAYFNAPVQQPNESVGLVKAKKE
uniref:Transmembrane protein 186 n=1 Tax=Ditylenchus dipsaci TaxID=166011 RepID=A0A915DWR1_9BILA